MRNLRVAALAVLLAAAGLGGGCGTSATGITLDIEPDPVPAAAHADGTYLATWDAVVADLTGVGGTVESVDVTLAGASAVSSQGDGPASFLMSSQDMAVAAFARRLFHLSARFTSAAGQPVSVQVTVRFRDGNGEAHQQSAQARVDLR